MLLNRDLKLLIELGTITSVSIVSDGKNGYLIKINNKTLHKQDHRIRTFQTMDGAAKTLLKYGIKSGSFDTSGYEKPARKAKISDKKQQDKKANEK